MAHKKAGGASKNGRDSEGQRLGIKACGGQKIKAGSIIIRQRGSKFYPGANAGQGTDFSIFAKVDGFVKFTNKIISVAPASA